MAHSLIFSSIILTSCTQLPLNTHQLWFTIKYLHAIILYRVKQLSFLRYGIFVGFCFEVYCFLARRASTLAIMKAHATMYSFGNFQYLAMFEVMIASQRWQLDQ